MVDKKCPKKQNGGKPETEPIFFKFTQEDSLKMYEAQKIRISGLNIKKY